jgi:HPt (histidine-containing phosphotransfer) domain-containing protein
MIQWSRVNELRNEVGAENFDEVLDLFLEEVDEVITRLKLAPVPAQLEQDLHFLKGSAMSLGFSAFSDLCQDGERRSAVDEAVCVDLAAIINGYEQSKTLFLAQWPNHVAA